MRKLFFLIVIGLLGCGGSMSNGKVYICNGPQSKVYHKTSTCRGLKRCSTDIEEIDISTAQERHRRQCRYCYNDEE